MRKANEHLPLSLSPCLNLESLTVRFYECLIKYLVLNNIILIIDVSVFYINECIPRVYEQVHLKKSQLYTYISLNYTKYYS